MTMEVSAQEYILYVYDMYLFVYEIGSHFRKNLHVDKGLQNPRKERLRRGVNAPQLHSWAICSIPYVLAPSVININKLVYNILNIWY